MNNKDTMKSADKKPIKKNDVDLWGLINKAIFNTDYVFMNHARKRQS